MVHGDKAFGINILSTSVLASIPQPADSLLCFSAPIVPCHCQPATIEPEPTNAISSLDPRIQA